MKHNQKSLPPLKALKCFEASARLRSLTLAAQELHVTQSAVSQQVKLLEEFLDTQLFIRKPRKLDLTDAARTYLPVLTDMFNVLQVSTNELFSKDHLINPPWTVEYIAVFWSHHPIANSQ